LEVKLRKGQKLNVNERWGYLVAYGQERPGKWAAFVLEKVGANTNLVDARTVASRFFDDSITAQNWLFEFTKELSFEDICKIDLISDGKEITFLLKRVSDTRAVAVTEPDETSEFYEGGVVEILETKADFSIEILAVDNIGYDTLDAAFESASKLLVRTLS
jgi:hypothetical protein